MDQLCVPEVKAQIEKEFQMTLEALKSDQDATSFTKLEKFCSEHQLTIVEKFILKQLLESLNLDGLSLLESNMDTFLNYLLAIVQK
jgi:hypothetical protein